MLLNIPSSGELRGRGEPGGAGPEQEPADGAEAERAAPPAAAAHRRPQPQPDQVIPQRRLQGHATGEWHLCMPFLS